MSNKKQAINVFVILLSLFVLTACSNTIDPEKVTNSTQSKEDFYETGIELTFENKDREHTSITPKNSSICTYEESDSFYIDARCNILIMKIDLLSIKYEDLPELDRTFLTNEFNTNVTNILKQYNGRIIDTNIDTSTIIVELLDDSQINKLYQTMNSKEYITVYYDMISTIDEPVVIE